MEKIIVTTGKNDFVLDLSKSEDKVNKELAAGWKLKDIRIEKTEP